MSDYSEIMSSVVVSGFGFAFGGSLVGVGSTARLEGFLGPSLIVIGVGVIGSTYYLAHSRARRLQQ